MGRISVRWLSSTLCFILACIYLTVPVLAQSTGAIVGSVTDATGAIVPGAGVSLTNLGTADKRTTVTDSDGSYRFLNLLPANYRLDFEMSGFKRLTREPVVVQVERTVRIDAVLELGNITEVVEVSAETPLLDTVTSSLAQVVEAKTVQEMPINGRNVMNLIALVPGVVAQGSTVGVTVASNQSAGHTINSWNNYQIGGGIAGTSAASLDGAPTIGLGGNSVQLIPTQDAIQEFRVVTNNVSPEYGRSGGGVVNLATKSGTNEFHGSVYEYFRNKVLNANDFFSNSLGTPKAPFNMNQFGATLGGPVRHDKTFFFFSWEQFRLKQGETYVTTVPTDVQLTGDFSADLGASTGIINPCTGQPVLKGQIFDPLTTTTVGGKTCRTPFSGNKIPSARFDATANVMANELKYWTSPNIDTPQGNFTNTPKPGGKHQQFNARVDENVSDNHRFFSRFTYWALDDIPKNRLGNITGGAPSHQHTHQAVLGDTYSFSPTLIMENRLSFTRGYYDDLPPSMGYDLSEFGPAWADLNNLVTIPELPLPSVTGLYVFGGMTVTSLHYRDTWALSSNLTKIFGHHMIKFGGEVRLMDYSTTSTRNSSGTFSFNSGFTSYNGTTGSTAGGIPFASFLLGYPYKGILETVQMAAQYSWYQGYYFADTYQLSDKLTLNYGVRWELPGAYAEKHDAATVLMPEEVDPLGSSTGLPLKGQLVLVNSSDWPGRGTQKMRYKYFVPRVGFAYRITDSTVVRGGYGIGMVPMDISGYNPSNSPILRASTDMVTSVNNAGLVPRNSLGSPFPAGGVEGTVKQEILQPAGRNYDLTSLEGLSISGPIPDQPYGYVQQWNLNIQKELQPGLLFEIGYAGSKGTHLAGGTQELNQLDSQYYSMGSALLNKVSNPLAGKVNPTGSLNGPTISQGQLYRPYPQFTSVENSAFQYGISNYHSMQVRLEKRFGAAGIISGNYTWSKFMGNVDTTNCSAEDTRACGAIQNYNNMSGEYSLETFDTPHRMVASYVLELPVGKGKRFAAGAHGVVSQLISGWKVNGILNFQSGHPLAISAQTNALATSFGAGTIRPNRVQGCDPVISGSAQSRINGWFNTACFEQPEAYSLGNEGRTDPDLRTQGANNIDFALDKSTAITERVKVQFKAEFFNLFNRVQFQLRNLQLGVKNFGVVGAQNNLPRLIQFSLRLVF